MLIKTTWRELVDNGLWEKYCRLKDIDGLSPNQGTNKEIKLKLTPYEAKKIDPLGDVFNVSK